MTGHRRRLETGWQLDNLQAQLVDVIHSKTDFGTKRLPVHGSSWVSAVVGTRKLAEAG